MIRTSKGAWMLILLLVLGSIFGSLIGNWLKDTLPFLSYGQVIGLSPATLDLAALNITFGFSLDLNIASIIGFFIALFIYTRL